MGDIAGVQIQAAIFGSRNSRGRGLGDENEGAAHPLASPGSLRVQVGEGLEQLAEEGHGFLVREVALGIGTVCGFGWNGFGVVEEGRDPR